MSDEHKVVPINQKSVQTLAMQAYKMRLSGSTLEEVAEELGRSPKEILEALNTQEKLEKASISSEERTGIVKLELARLDALQKAHWPSAMCADPKSTDAILKIMAMRAKYLGLDQIDPEVNRQTVLVVGDSEKDYIAALKRSEG